MRVLFLHTAMSGVSAEYKVHMTLAKHARSEALDPYFIWQSPSYTDRIGRNAIIAHDFGRDFSIKPRPSHYRRTLMTIQRLPYTLMFLVAKARQLQPDLIYTSQQYFDVFVANFVSKVLSIPHVIHIHYSVGPWLGKYTLNAIRKSSRLIAVSEYTRQTALLQSVSPSHIHTVINPASTGQNQAQSGTTPHAIRAEFKLDDDTPLVLAVGRLDPGKGHMALFEAFSQLIQHIPSARLLICGASSVRDNYEDQLRQRVNALQIQPYTIFAGQRSDIPAIMRSANVFCLPTELDPCPLVFLEAMAEGLPVVACYSGGVPEMVLHNQTGLLSYPGDIQALATNLQRILSNPIDAHQFGEAGRQRASIEFAPSKSAERWLRVLKEKI